jgi:hypothetical protein
MQCGYSSAAQYKTHNRTAKIHSDVFNGEWRTLTPNAFGIGIDKKPRSVAIS